MSWQLSIALGFSKGDFSASCVIIIVLPCSSVLLVDTLVRAPVVLFCPERWVELLEGRGNMNDTETGR